MPEQQQQQQQLNKFVNVNFMISNTILDFTDQPSAVKRQFFYYLILNYEGMKNYLCWIPLPYLNLFDETKHIW